ncbi:MAG: hypothetical protein IJT53_03425 [Prevotella sp.]|nr:hypothetical protein [Prevotella sp.]
MYTAGIHFVFGLNTSQLNFFGGRNGDRGGNRESRGGNRESRGDREGRGNRESRGDREGRGGRVGGKVKVPDFGAGWRHQESGDW